MSFIQKNTAGAAIRQVGDQIVSTVEVRGTGASGLIFNYVPENNPLAVEPPGFTNNGLAVFDVDPNNFATGAALLSGWGFEAGGVLTYTQPISAGSYTSLQLNITQTDADWLIETLDGATVIGTATIAQLASGFISGPFPTGAFSFRITRLTFSPPVQNSDGVLYGVDLSELGLDIVNISDLVPAAPAGTTRTWTAVDSNTPTQFMEAPIPPTAGVGGIVHTLRTIGAASRTYTITDTVNNVGVYTNTATTTSSLTPNDSVSGQSVTIQAAAGVGNPTTRPQADKVCDSELVRLCRQTGTEKLCDLTVPATPVEILLVTIASESGDVIPTNSTEFPALAGAGVFTTLGFYRSYYTDLQGVLLSPQPTTVGECDCKDWVIELCDEIVTPVPTTGLFNTTTSTLTDPGVVTNLNFGGTTDDVEISSTGTLGLTSEIEAMDGFVAGVARTETITVTIPAGKKNIILDIARLQAGQGEFYLNWSVTPVVVSGSYIVVGGNDVHPNAGGVNPGRIQVPDGTTSFTFDVNYNAPGGSSPGAGITGLSYTTDETTFVRFQRCYKSCGGVVTFEDLTFTGTPYVIVGTLGQCEVTCKNWTEKLVDRRDTVLTIDAIYTDGTNDTIEYRELINNVVLFTGPTGYSTGPNGALNQETGTYYNLQSANNTLEVWDVNNLGAGSTALPIVPPLPVNPTANMGAYDPSSGLIYFAAQGNWRRSVNPLTGVSAVVPPVINSGGSTLNAMAITRDGVHYIAKGNANIYRMDNTTGILTLVGNPGVVGVINGFGVDTSAEELGFISISALSGSITRWTKEDASDAAIVANSPNAGGTIDIVDVNIQREDVCFIRCFESCNGVVTFVDLDENGQPFTPTGAVLLCATDTQNVGSANVRLTCADITDTAVEYTESVRAVIDQVVNVRLCGTVAGAEFDAVYSNAEEICVENPALTFTTQFVRQRQIVDNVNGAVTSTVTEYSTDGATWSAVVPAGTIRAGNCQVSSVSDHEIKLLCDVSAGVVVSQFLRRYVVSPAGVVTTVDTTLDGVTPYVVLGTASNCAAFDPSPDSYQTTILDVPPSSAFVINFLGTLVSWTVRNRTGALNTIQANGGAVLPLDLGESISDGGIEEEEGVLQDTINIVTGVGGVVRVTVARRL